MRALDAALNAVWAMEERALETLLDIAARDNTDVTPQALEAYRAKALDGTQRATVRKGVAILGVTGPLFKRANLFTAISGASSYDVLRTDLQAALDDPKVNAILLDIDSPGGEVNGGNELAQAIYAARGTKPIVAYVGGTGASMAYWIASSASKVVVDPTAILGSIGTQVAFAERAPAAGEKRYRFVSTQSPNKNPDPGTDAFDKSVQSTIDALSAVFIDAVARNRGVTVAAVLSDFGKGGTFVGQMAVDAGLADSVGDFESVLAECSASRISTPSNNDRKTKMMTDATVPSAYIEQAVAAAMANAARSTPAETETRAEPVVSAEEARAAEEDAIVARISGDASIVAQGIERRARERQRADKGQAAAAAQAREASETEALAARIIAA